MVKRGGGNRRSRREPLRDHYIVTCLDADLNPSCRGNKRVRYSLRYPDPQLYVKQVYAKIFRLEPYGFIFIASGTQMILKYCLLIYLCCGKYVKLFLCHQFLATFLFLFNCLVFSVGKQSPSFVHTSCDRERVRTALNFGNHIALFIRKKAHSQTQPNVCGHLLFSFFFFFFFLWGGGVSARTFSFSQ